MAYLLPMNDHQPTQAKGSAIPGVLGIVGFTSFYFAAQLWILPAAGIPT